MKSRIQLILSLVSIFLCSSDVLSQDHGVYSYYPGPKSATNHDQSAIPSMLNKLTDHEQEVLLSLISNNKDLQRLVNIQQTNIMNLEKQLESCKKK